MIRKSMVSILIIVIYIAIVFYSYQQVIEQKDGFVFSHLLDFLYILCESSLTI